MAQGTELSGPSPVTDSWANQPGSFSSYSLYSASTLSVGFISKCQVTGTGESGDSEINFKLSHCTYF